MCPYLLYNLVLIYAKIQYLIGNNVNKNLFHFQFNTHILYKQSLSPKQAEEMVLREAEPDLVIMPQFNKMEK